MHTTQHPTLPLCHALAPFGLTPTTLPDDTHNIRRHAHHLAHQLPTRGLVLFTGPSGSGKSRLLRAVRHALDTTPRHTADANAPIHHPHLTPIDALTGPIDRRLALLARFGLAEPRLWPRPIHTLSDGERARFALARAVSTLPDSSAHPPLLIIDELASLLDRNTARSLAATLARWARALPPPGVLVLAATAHADMARFLAPDLLINPARADTLAPRPPRRAAHPQPTITPATIDDYRALAHLHYLAPRPATIAGVWRAQLPDADRPRARITAGVLVASLPTRQGLWRRYAWPNRYSGRDRAAALARLNAEVRCISRVIVDPRFRGLGVAHALVRAYLAAPLTPATEAVAAMGRLVPFFASAGMTAYPLPRRAPDERLLDACAHAELEPAALLTAAGARRAHQHPLLIAELARWCRATRDPGGPDALTRAALRLLRQPVAYAAGGIA